MENKSKEAVMSRTWQTNEVIRRLTTDGDLDEVQELLEEAGDEAAEALEDWVKEGNGPKSLYDAIMRFATNPNHAFDAVDWDVVVRQVLQER